MSTLKSIFGKETDFAKKVKRLENLNRDIVKSSTNNRIVTISPDRYCGSTKKSVEHYNNPKQTQQNQPIKKGNTKKNSIALIVDNPINLNNYLNEKTNIKTKSVEKVKKTNNNTNNTIMTDHRVPKNKRQNTESYGLFVNNLNYENKQPNINNHKEQKEHLKWKTISNKKLIETLSNSTEQKNVLIDSIDILDTDMLGKNLIIYHK